MNQEKLLRLVANLTVEEIEDITEYCYKSIINGRKNLAKIFILMGAEHYS